MYKSLVKTTYPVRNRRHEAVSNFSSRFSDGFPLFRSMALISPVSVPNLTGCTYPKSFPLSHVIRNSIVLFPIPLRYLGSRFTGYPSPNSFHLPCSVAGSRTSNLDNIPQLLIKSSLFNRPVHSTSKCADVLGFDQSFPVAFHIRIVRIEKNFGHVRTLYCSWQKPHGYRFSPVVGRIRLIVYAAHNVHVRSSPDKIHNRFFVDVRLWIPL